jgi:hypothetical protein
VTLYAAGEGRQLAAELTYFTAFCREQAASETRLAASKADLAALFGNSPGGKTNAFLESMDSAAECVESAAERTLFAAPGHAP